MPPRRGKWDDFLDTWDERLRRAFLESVNNIRTRAQLNAIAAAIERGDIAGAVRSVGLDPASFRPFDRTIEQAFEAGGQKTLGIVPAVARGDGARLRVDFNIRNPTAETWLRTHSGTKIVQIIEDQRTMVRTHLTESMTQGIGPRTAALDLVGRINPTTGRREGGVLGLTSSQAEWVRNYRQEVANGSSAALNRNLRDKRFDAAVQRSIRTGEPIPADTQSAMVNAYKNRALRNRAETIARTEAMASIHQSQEEAMRQAMEAGIDPDSVGYVWRTAADSSRVRDSHATMNGQEVGVDEPFVTGNGVRLMYPGDPDGPPEEIINCRCWREPRVDFLADLD